MDDMWMHAKHRSKRQFGTSYALSLTDQVLLCPSFNTIHFLLNRMSHFSADDLIGIANATNVTKNRTSSPKAENLCPNSAYVSFWGEYSFLLLSSLESVCQKLL